MRQQILYTILMSLWYLIVNFRLHWLGFICLYFDCIDIDLNLFWLHWPWFWFYFISIVLIRIFIWLYFDCFDFDLTFFGLYLFWFDFISTVQKSFVFAARRSGQMAATNWFMWTLSDSLIETNPSNKIHYVGVRQFSNYFFCFLLIGLFIK